MSSSAVDVEVRLKLKDGATAGLKATSQAAEQAASKSAVAAEKAASKSVAAVNAQHDSHIKAYQEIARARETLGVRSERVIRDEIALTKSAYESLARSGAASARELARAQDASIRKVRELRQEMGELTKMQRLTQVAQVGAAVGAGGMAAKAVIDNPVRSYTDLESAQADLKIALMAKGGKVSAAYDEVMKQATDLGNKLPGATKDFVAAASALKEQGMTESAITGGGLKASAYFGVLADMNQYQSATTIAKMREAYGLGDKELPEMANLMQKARYAYGIHPDDFRAVAQYAAPTYNTLHLTGLQNAKELLAVQGMAASVGLENTSFGTNFAMMLQRTAQIDSRLGGKGKEATEAREALAEHGIKMNFYDQQGRFAGIEHMFAELDKLKPLKDIDRMHVLNKLFGVEASRPASIIIEKGGVAGFKESLAKQESQADMEERISMKTSTLKSKDEALDGTWENTKASAAKGIGESKKGFLDAVNAVLGDTVQPMLEKHPDLGTGAVTTAAAGAGMATTAGSLMALRAIMGTESGLRMLSAIPGITAVANVASRIPVVPRGVGMFGLAAGLGGAVLSSVAGEESATARYGSAALTGAGIGATIGSIVPILGTGAGAAVGGGLGLLAQGIADALKPSTEQKPVDVNFKAQLSLAPGLVLQSQSMQATGGNVTMNTGNVWNGAPR
jgi:TP901 family phage tail tape measure protein